MSAPSSPGGDGRDARGRFATGNREGRGNPAAARVGRLRFALLDAIGEDDVRAIAAKLVAEALAGNIQAAREILVRVLGALRRSTCSCAWRL